MWFLLRHELNTGIAVWKGLVSRASRIGLTTLSTDGICRIDWV
jgi:hypothetical protein